MTGRRSAQVGRAVAGSPELAELLREQVYAVELLRSAAPEVPDALRADRGAAGGA